DAAGNHSTLATITAATSACGADTTPPSKPTNLNVTATSATSLAIAWAASTDNVGVTGYTAYLSGLTEGTTTLLSWTFTGLTCGTSYTFAVDAFDAAGNHSTLATITASTSACSDTTPPSQPGGLQVTNTTATALTISWTASTDNVGVAGYTVYKNGVFWATTTATNTTFANLACNSTFTLGVDAYDASNNHSTLATVTATTGACDTMPPSEPTNFRTSTTGETSISTSWSASTDNVGVACYTLYVNGVSQGTTTLTNYTFSGLACGTGYTLGVDAFDTSGNHSTAVTATATTASCTPGVVVTVDRSHPLKIAPLTLASPFTIPWLRA